MVGGAANEGGNRGETTEAGCFNVCNKCFEADSDDGSRCEFGFSTEVFVAAVIYQGCGGLTMKNVFT